MWFYRILLGFNTLALLALAYFFLDGLQYNPGGAYFTTWVLLLGLPLVVIAGAVLLRSKGQKLAATLLLSVLALPPLAYVLFFGLLLATNPGWH